MNEHVMVMRIAITHNSSRFQADSKNYKINDFPLLIILGIYAK